MGLFGKDSEDKWKKRYYELNDEFDAFKKDSRSVESDLKEAIDNVSFAAEGIDQELDFQVKRIKVQLEGHAEASHLCNTSRAIAETKKRLNKDLSAKLKDTIAKLIEFSYKLPNANQIKKHVQSIEKQLQEVDDKDTPRVLQELINYLKEGLPTSGSMDVEVDAKPWYSKLFSFGAKKIDLEPLTTILKYLLEHLTVPPQLEDEVMQIKTMIESEEESNVLTALDLTSQLVIKIHKANEEQFNHFLGEINDQISVIEEILFKQEKYQVQQKDHTIGFGTHVKEYFSNLSSEVSAFDSLDKLKSHMSQTISTIMTKVQDYTDKQMEIHDAQEREIAKLNEKIRETELVTNDLIEELSKTTLEAQQDPLTELPNRAAYDKRIVQEFERWQRYQHPLVIMVTDIDHFKGINDNYGHKAGDKVLHKVAQQLKASLRKIDFVGRYGGEEFVILMEKTTLKDAERIANKLRVEIEKMGFHFNNKPVQVTTSLGLTIFKEGDTPDSAFERADKALYESKNNGRNRVTVL